MGRFPVYVRDAPANAATARPTSTASRAPAVSRLHRPSRLSMLFSALWEAIGPRKGRSPLTSGFSPT
jgi:hypothetical protein